MSGEAGTLKMTGAKFAKGYKASSKMGPIDIWRHFTTRGHHGRVTCVGANGDSQFIITGGVDYSVRVWISDNMYEAYALYAVLNLPVPVEAQKQAAEKMSFCSRMKEMVQPTIIDWDAEADQGATALNFLSIKRKQAPRPGQEDGEYGTINGPTVIGTADGCVYVLDFAALHTDSANAIYSHPKIHTGKINDISFMYKEEGEDGTSTFLVVTAGVDKTARVSVMEVQEVDSPEFFSKDEQKRNKLLDVLFFAGGQPNPDQDGPTSVDAKTCLKFVSMRTVATLKHDEPVIESNCLDFDFRPDAHIKILITFITCTKEGAFLWNSDGELLMRLKVQTETNKKFIDCKLHKKGKVHCKEHQSTASVVKLTKVWDHEGKLIKRVQALLFLAGTDTDNRGQVGVWGIQDGVLGFKEWDGTLSFHKFRQEGMIKTSKHRRLQADDAEDKSDAEPLCVYDRDGDLLDVEQTDGLTRFAVQLAEDRSTVNIWSLQAIQPGSLVVEPDGPASLLVTPGKDDVLLQLSHKVRVADMLVVQDLAGPAVITGCDDGAAFAWDLDGDDKGQIYAELRSLKPTEIIMPPLVLFITTAQMLSFAFGPSIPWQTDVHQKVSIVHQICMGDFKFVVEVNKELIFWPEMIFIVCAAALFMAVAVFGLDERMDDFVAKAYNLESYRKQKLCVAYLWVKTLSSIRTTTYLFMQLTSTLLVVPMMKAAATSFHCIDGGLDKNGTSVGLVVAAAPTVKCFQGPHLQLSIALVMLIPPFLFMLLPYAVVNGDAHYVASSCLFEYKFWEKKNAWRLAAARKATTLHLAFLHFNPKHAFESLSVDLAGKIFLPVVSTLTISEPLLQMCLLSAMNFFVYFNSLRHAPYVERKFCVIVQDLKLIIFCASATGIFTTLQNDKSSYLTCGILGVILSLVVLLMIVQLCLLEAKKPFGKKLFVMEGAKAADSRMIGDEEAPLLKVAEVTPSGSDREQE